jgi:hypothetical protein
VILGHAQPPRNRKNEANKTHTSPQEQVPESLLSDMTGKAAKADAFLPLISP